MTVGRLMPNVEGFIQTKRALITSVVGSKLLHASLIWAVNVSQTARNRAVIIRTKRYAALRVTRLYRTVSIQTA